MKILIIHKNWLGDILCQLPAVEAIRKAYPEAYLASIAPERCREILEAHPAIDEVIGFDEKKEHRSFFSKLAFAKQLRTGHWDRVYFLHRSRTRSFLLWLGGVKERIGYGQGRQWFLTQAIAEPRQPLHQVDYFLYLISQSGLSVDLNAKYRFYFSPKTSWTAREILRQRGLQPKTFMCFHLGANWEPKRWPAKHFAALADKIHETWHLPVVVTGSGDDLKLFLQMKNSIVKAKLISLIGHTSLEQLGAVFQNALCLVTGDSGPMHIASGIGIPVIALFGPTDPALTGPRGVGETAVLSYVPEGYTVPWYGKSFPKEGWLSHIQPDEVFSILKRKGWLDHRQESQTASAVVDDFKKDQKNQPVKSILLVTLSNIGDVILTTPVLTSLVSRFPSARMTVVCGPRAKGILEGSRYIDRLVIYDKKAGFFKQAGFLWELKKNAYDLVVDLRNTAIPFLVSARTRSPLIRKYHSELRRERHLEVLQMMNLQVEDPPVFDFYSEKEELSMLEKIKKEGVSSDKNWIVVAPVAASGLKTWPLSRFKKVLEALLTEYSSEILLVGDNRERVLAGSLTESDPNRVINVAGKLSLRETAALIARAGLLLSNDSALMHIGFELNRPVAAVFGPTNPNKYGRTGKNFRIIREPVSCSPCEKPSCRFERQACFEDLNPEKVIQACRELLYERVPAVR